MHRNSPPTPPHAHFVALLALCAALATAAEPKPPLVRQLSEFGDPGGKSLRETYEKAIAELRKSGGVLEVSAGDWNVLQPADTKESSSLSPSPHPSPAGRGGHAVRVASNRGGRQHERATKRFPLPAGEG